MVIVSYRWLIVLQEGIEIDPRTTALQIQISLDIEYIADAIACFFRQERVFVCQNTIYTWDLITLCWLELLNVSSIKSASLAEQADIAGVLTILCGGFTL